MRSTRSVRHDTVFQVLLTTKGLKMPRSKNLTVQMTVKGIKEEGGIFHLTGDRGYLYEVKKTVAGATGLKKGVTYSVDIDATDAPSLPKKERVTIKKINGPIKIESDKVPTTEGRGKAA